MIEAEFAAANAVGDAFTRPVGASRALAPPPHAPRPVIEAEFAAANAVGDAFTRDAGPRRRR